MEMPQLRKSANRADSLSCLEKSRQKAARLSHISTGPYSCSAPEKQVRNPPQQLRDLGVKKLRDYSIVEEQVGCNYVRKQTI